MFLGAPPLGGHNSDQSNTYQIWRAGRWTIPVSLVFLIHTEAFLPSHKPHKLALLVKQLKCMMVCGLQMGRVTNHELNRNTFSWCVPILTCRLKKIGDPWSKMTLLKCTAFWSDGESSGWYCVPSLALSCPPKILFLS